MSWWSSAQSSPTKIIRSPPNCVVVQPIQSPRPPGGNLMDQCSVARHPISATGDLTNRPGHDLQLEIDQRPRFSLCSPAGGSVISLPRSKPNPCQEHADRFPLGSKTAWRAAIGPPAALQNSHQNGAPTLLMFVADPRTVWLCRISFQGLCLSARRSGTSKAGVC